MKITSEDTAIRVSKNYNNWLRKLIRLSCKYSTMDTPKSVVIKDVGIMMSREDNATVYDRYAILEIDNNMCYMLCERCEKEKFEKYIGMSPAAISLYKKNMLCALVYRQLQKPTVVCQDY